MNVLNSPRMPLWLVHALGDSSLSFAALLTSSLSSRFELQAPDWPGARPRAGRASLFLTREGARSR